MTLGGQRIRFAADDRQHSHHHEQANEKAQGAIAPMHGIVVAVLVEQGQTVSKGQPLLVLEAMKMEHQLRAERDGVIEALQCKQGEQVSQGAVLVRFAEETASQEEHP
jgi:3-methylcrotonyl-CoA carboxylase alpha subunit